MISVPSLRKLAIGTLRGSSGAHRGRSWRAPLCSCALVMFAYASGLVVGSTALFSEQMPLILRAAGLFFLVPGLASFAVAKPLWLHFWLHNSGLAVGRIVYGCLGASVLALIGVFFDGWVIGAVAEQASFVGIPVFWFALARTMPHCCIETPVLLASGIVASHRTLTLITPLRPERYSARINANLQQSIVPMLLSVALLLPAALLEDSGIQRGVERYFSKRLGLHLDPPRVVKMRSSENAGSHARIRNRQLQFETISFRLPEDFVPLKGDNDPAGHPHRAWIHTADRLRRILIIHRRIGDFSNPLSGALEMRYATGLVTAQLTTPRILEAQTTRSSNSLLRLQTVVTGSRRRQRVVVVVSLLATETDAAIIYEQARYTDGETRDRVYPAVIDSISFKPAPFWRRQ